MTPIEELLKKRNDVFIDTTNQILSKYKSKLDALLSLLTKQTVDVNWKYISVDDDDGDKRLFIHGFINIEVGQSVLDTNGYEVKITERNKTEYLQYVKLFLTPDQLDNKSVEVIASEIGKFVISPQELNESEFNGLRDSSSLKANDKFEELLNNMTIPKTKH